MSGGLDIPVDQTKKTEKSEMRIALEAWFKAWVSETYHRKWLVPTVLPACGFVLIGVNARLQNTPISALFCVYGIPLVVVTMLLTMRVWRQYPGRKEERKVLQDHDEAVAGFAGYLKEHRGEKISSPAQMRDELDRAKAAEAVHIKEIARLQAKCNKYEGVGFAQVGVLTEQLTRINEGASDVVAASGKLMDLHKYSATTMRVLRELLEFTQNSAHDIRAVHNTVLGNDELFAGLIPQKWVEPGKRQCLANKDKECKSGESAECALVMGKLGDNGPARAMHVCATCLPQMLPLTKEGFFDASFLQLSKREVADRGYDSMYAHAMARHDNQQPAGDVPALPPPETAEIAGREAGSVGASTTVDTTRSQPLPS